VSPRRTAQSRMFNTLLRRYFEAMRRDDLVSQITLSHRIVSDGYLSSASEVRPAAIAAAHVVR
jgi:hypothetical protein